MLRSPLRLAARSARTGAPLVLAALVILVAASTATGSPRRIPATAASVSVIVTTDGPGAAHRAVTAVGGTVTRPLPLIGAVAARVPAAALTRLGRAGPIGS